MIDYASTSIYEDSPRGIKVINVDGSEGSQAFTFSRSRNLPIEDPHVNWSGIPFHWYKRKKKAQWYTKIYYSVLTRYLCGETSSVESRWCLFLMSQKASQSEPKPTSAPVYNNSKILSSEGCIITITAHWQIWCHSHNNTNRGIGRNIGPIVHVFQTTLYKLFSSYSLATFTKPLNSSISPWSKPLMSYLLAAVCGHNNSQNM